MSNKEEDIKKQLARERAQRISAEEQVLFEQQEANKRRVAQESQFEQSLNDAENEALASPLVVKPIITDSSCDWQQILGRYKNEYPDRTVQDNCLIFSSKDEALTFFREQAKAEYTFLVQELVNGQPSGFYCFSCGNGMLYSGRLEDIQQQIQHDQQKQPSPKLDGGLALIAKYMAPNPATNFRSALSEQRDNQNETQNSAKPDPLAPKRS